jgi:tRNA1(Val) A37 N6-methylase TrmN6
MSFDHVLANPPFHPAGAPAADDAGRDAAHREGEAALGDWIDASLRRLASGGRLALIHRPERLGAILAALARRAGSIEILPVAPRAAAPATRVLVRARKGARGPTRLWPPLTLHEENTAAAEAAGYTEAAQGVLRGMQDLLPETASGL